MKLLLFSFELLKEMWEFDWMGRVLAVFMGVYLSGVVALATMVGYQFYQDYAHPCLRYQSYMAPASTTFVYSGKVLVPIFTPAHESAYCVERQP